MSLLTNSRRQTLRNSGFISMQLILFFKNMFEPLHFFFLNTKMLIVNDSGNKCSWQDKTNGLKSLNLFSWSVFTMCDTVLKAIHFLNRGCGIYSCDFYISFCQGRAKNLILYHTIYKQGITKFFSKELLLGEDRSCGNVTLIATASF